MPDSVGNAFYNGQLHTKWNDIASSGAKLIRFGGISVDNNMPTNHQYIKMIDSIRARGMEPIIQVPFYNNKYSASQAAAIVQYVNITKGRNIKYWVIGNEPDLEYNYTSASQVASYFRAFASAMKAVDPNIMIIGPETAWYNTNIINGLTTAGGPDDITGTDAYGRYYLDIFSFHIYPFNGTQNRSSVITRLTEPGYFQDNLTDLNTRISSCNNFHGRAGATTIKMAVTEANINYINNASDGLYGTGANSFIGGQFWIDMMGICMKKNIEFINFWSVIEGNNNAYNIGFLDKNNGNKKPIYYHFQMLANNFRGTYCNGTSNRDSIKAFGSKDGNQIAVIILNQEIANNSAYTVRLNNDPIAGNNPLKVNIDAGTAVEYSDIINNQSSTLLIFDASGSIIKKIEYKLTGNANLNLPPTTTILNGTVGIQDSISNVNRNLIRVRAYPNPTKGNLTVEVNDVQRVEDNITIELLNALGQVVYHRKPVIENKKINEKIEINPILATGIYILRVTIADDIYDNKILLSR